MIDTELLSKQVAEARGESPLTWYSLYKVDGGNMTNVELSACVAESRGEIYHGCSHCGPELFSNGYKHHKIRCSCGRLHRIKPYATDINLAGELLDEINHTLYWELSPCYREGVICFRASAYDIHGDMDYNFEGVGLTKAIAICKLYLVFKGKTIKVEGGN